MFSGAPKKHILNTRYVDKTNKFIDFPGTQKQVTIIWKKGNGSRPKTHWHIQMSDLETDDRDFFIDPSVKLYADDEKSGLLGNQPFSSYLVTLPDVSGISYKVTYFEQDSRKELGEVSFQTWRRVNLKFECSDKFYYGIFEKALEIIEAAFAEAFIEIVLNEYKIGNVEKTLRESNSSTSVLVRLNEQEWEKNSRLFQFKVTSKALQATEGLEKIFQKQGDQLVLNLAHPLLQSRWRLQIPRSDRQLGCLESIKVIDKDGKALVSIPKEKYQWTAEDYSSLKAIYRCSSQNRAINNDAEVQNADALIIDLASNPLKLVKQALDQGQELSVELVLKLEEFGRTAGQAIKGITAVDIIVDRQIEPSKLANTIVHELGHVFGLTKWNEKNKNNQTVQNPLCYDDRYGGQGTHCSYNAKQIKSASTVSGLTYEFDKTKDRLCVMHFAVSDHVHKARFCPTCIKHLRRTKMP